MKNITAEELYQHIKIIGECWIWQKRKTQEGYGQVVISEIGEFPIRKTGAHRISYALKNGPILKGQIICHKCDTPSCINPDHLFAGTNLDNVKDMLAKKRHAQQVKTHCKNGHEFTPENTIIRKASGRRGCRICINESFRELRRKRAISKKKNDNKRSK